MATLYTFGDSVLDCGLYNQHGVTPGKLLVRNDDRLFPEFIGRDLGAVLGEPVTLAHRATDGATVDDLPRQLRGANPAAGDVVVLSIGGNDTLVAFSRGIAFDMEAFRASVRSALASVARAQVLVANVYDPTFGNDARNWLGVDPVAARAHHAALNAALAEEAAHANAAVLDLHAHFLRGRPSWFTRTIEPSLEGASEVRRAVLEAVAASNES